MYDYLIVTHLPAFYKVNLYNELAKNKKIKVAFIANETLEKRSNDFSSLDNAKFEYEILNEKNFQKRNKILTLCQLLKLKVLSKYKKILISGWDLPEFWLLAFSSPKSKNCLALESTLYESSVSGVRGLIKKIFLSRISTVFASGDLHKKLLTKLSFCGAIKITKGVGIINKPFYDGSEKVYKRKFLFVGRISEVKNLSFLVNVFNDLPMHYLSIVGDGDGIDILKKKANKNITFLGAIDNSKVKEVYLSHDFFILPSLSETWGLVIEEALYFGLPVMVSERCGACELIKPGVNGFIINPYNTNELITLIQSMDNVKFNELLKNLSINEIDKKDMQQVSCYENI